MRLPPHWEHALEDLPGYDADQHLVRLTTKLEITSVERNHSIGFLGRAHPLVRRALHRVRNLSFGGPARQGQDPRASAVEADVPQPCRLYTFLGRVSSRAGRELERVLAVNVTAAGEPTFFASAGEWLPLPNQQRAIRTTDIWKNHFQSWASHAAHAAGQAAATGFRPSADEFITGRQQTLTQERRSQEESLAKRSEEITGPVRPSAALQRTLLESDVQPAASGPAPAWQSLTDPVERLAAFHGDRTQMPRERVEAEGVLRIYQQRIKHLDGLADLHQPEIIPLGLLMIVPKEAGSGA